MTTTITREFVTAGRAEFTIDNGKAERFTFRVSRSKRYPSILNVYRLHVRREYMGTLKPATLSYVVNARKGAYTNPADVVNKVFAFAMRIISGAQALPDGYSIRHTNKCGRCGKKLRDESSIATGFGPDCADILRKARITTVVNEAATIADAIVRPVPVAVAAPVVVEPAVCGACGGTGQFVSRKTGRPAGKCFRCEGKGVQDASDKQRNYGYDNFYRGRVADGF